MNSASISHTQEFAEFGRWIDIVIIAARTIIANHQMIACFGVDAIVKTRDATVANFDVSRRLCVEQAKLANRDTISGEIRPTNRISKTVKDHVTRLDGDTFAVLAHIIEQAITTR